MSLIELHYLKVPSPYVSMLWVMLFIASAYSSNFCWEIATHMSLCQLFALTCPPEPHAVQLTTPCWSLKSMCSKAKPVSCFTFLCQICLQHSHTVLNHFVFVSLISEFHVAGTHRGWSEGP